MPKLVVLTAISLAMIACGAVWFAKSRGTAAGYEFAEDFKRTFLTPHWTYSAFYNDGKPRRIVPVVMLCGGIGLLVLGWTRALLR